MRKTNEVNNNNNLLLNHKINNALTPQLCTYLPSQHSLNIPISNQNLNNQINDLSETNREINSSTENQNNKNNYLTNIIQDISDYDNYGMLSYYYTTCLYLQKTSIENNNFFMMNSNNYLPKSFFLYQEDQNNESKPVFNVENKIDTNNNNNLDNNIVSNLTFPDSISINNSINEINLLNQKNNKNENIIIQKICNMQSQIKNNTYQINTESSNNDIMQIINPCSNNIFKLTNSEISKNNYFNQNKNNIVFSHLEEPPIKNIYQDTTTINDNNNHNKNNDYIYEMFGHRGWICKKCHNFNYETRKKCNRCGSTKRLIKIFEFDKKESKENIITKGDWLCKNCQNLNYGFRKVCNRCKIPKTLNNPNKKEYVKNFEKQLCNNISSAIKKINYNISNISNTKSNINNNAFGSKIVNNRNGNDSISKNMSNNIQNFEVSNGNINLNFYFNFAKSNIIQKK